MPSFTIQRLGAAGDGIAEADGRSFFIPGALPGEIVEAETVSPTHGRLLRVVEPSSDRIAAACRHFLYCGSCAVQELAPAPYGAWKRGMLVEALSRAGFADAPVAPLVQIPAGTRRRADFALRRQADGSVRMGFHARGSAEVVGVEECPVLAPALTALFGPLAVLLRSISALRRQGSLVMNLLDSGPDLLLRTDGLLDPPARMALARFAETHSLPRIAWGVEGEEAAETATQRGPTQLVIGGAVMQPAPGAFLQASAEGEAAIAQAVLAGLPRLRGKARIADLFAGLGTISIPLSTKGAVDSFEGNAAAVTALSGAGIGRIRAQRRDLARQPLLPPELLRFTTVVLDPPYAGAAAQIGQIARCKVPRVIYVSCNPQVLGKEAAQLRQAGYRVVSATPIDQFPWSAELESVVVFAGPGARD